LVKEYPDSILRKSQPIAAAGFGPIQGAIGQFDQLLNTASTTPALTVRRRVLWRLDVSRFSRPWHAGLGAPIYLQSPYRKALEPQPSLLMQLALLLCA